jgi:hypothetical protein
LFIATLSANDDNLGRMKYIRNRSFEFVVTIPAYLALTTVRRQLKIR